MAQRPDEFGKELLCRIEVAAMGSRAKLRREGENNTFIATYSYLWRCHLFDKRCASSRSE
jgi:hypothetical protein